MLRVNEKIIRDMNGKINNVNKVSSGPTLKIKLKGKLQGQIIFFVSQTFRG